MRAWRRGRGSLRFFNTHDQWRNNEMAIIKTPKERDYVAVSNALANDERLSFEARGVLLYLLSKPADWEIQFVDVEKQGKIGREKRQRIFAELEKYGYFERIERRSAGKFDYDYQLHETPVNIEPQPRTGLPLTVEPSPVNPPHTNKDRQKKDRERGERAKTDSPIEVETTNKGLRGIAANQSAKQKLDEYLDAIREFYGGALGDEFRWGNACIKAIEKGFTSGELIAALTALMSQPRKFQITPENVLQFASETRVRERLLAEQQPKTYSGSPLIPDEIKEKLRQAQENYYAGI